MQVQRQLKRNLDNANQYFQKTFIPPTVSYNVRGLKAGVAYLQKNEIRFNPTLLAENGTKFIRQVVPHELAHIIVFQQFGRVAPHGKEWKQLMQNVFGVPADIYHRFDTTNVQETRIPYRCECRLHTLSQRQHNFTQQTNRYYICRHCKTPLYHNPTINP